MTSSQASRFTVQHADQWVPALRAHFHADGFDSDGLLDLLGPTTLAALHRGEPGPVRHRLAHLDPADLLRQRRARWVTLLILGDPLSRQELSDFLGEELCTRLVASGVLVPHEQDPTLLVAGIDIRPHRIDGCQHWVFSDRDASFTRHVPGRDHVLGVGAASLSLLDAVPTTPARRVLDLGCGSGIQTLGQWRCAEQIVSTDVHEPALAFAHATLLAAPQDDAPEFSLRHGSWFEPVAGERFDRIIANPPFVVATPKVGHVYRDSGVDLDGATALVIEGACEHLDEGGQAFLLGSWVDTEVSPWQQRVASWVPEHGYTVWVIQRDLVDPELYVGTWLKDEGLDPRDPAAQERAQEWLEHFDRAGVRGVGMGIIAIERIGDDPSEVLAEDLPHTITDPLGPEILDYFERVRWLREQDADSLLDARYRLRPQLAKEDVSLPDESSGMGFLTVTLRITRTEGPRFSHDIDDALLSILSGLHPQGMTLRDVLELWATVHDVDPQAPTAEGLSLEDEVRAAIVDLVRHGMILPAELPAQRSAVG